MKNFDDWVSSVAALDALGVKPGTLYAYVSRGWIRAVSDPSDSRRSLYAASDIQALIDRRRRPRKRAEIAAGTIAWGEPIIESSISTIADGKLFFGDDDASVLCETYSLEDIAAHHWRSFPTEPAISVVGDETADVLTPKSRAFYYLAQLAGTCPSSQGQPRNALTREARNILAGFADALLGAALPGPIHQKIAAAWDLPTVQADAVRQVLVLISDHELNASTFAVRVAASTGASLSSSLLAGLCALSGPLHGDASEEALVFFSKIMAASDPSEVIDEMLMRHKIIPGMGHNLYPDGDVRAKRIFDIIKPSEFVTQRIAACCRARGEEPNVDMAIAVMAHMFGLPSQACFSIFALGRLTGWLAHAMEQAESGQLIRPRAVFRHPSC